MRKLMILVFSGLFFLTTCNILMGGDTSPSKTEQKHDQKTTKKTVDPKNGPKTDTISKQRVRTVK